MTFFSKIEHKVFFVVALTVAATALAVYMVTHAILYQLLLDDIHARITTVNEYTEPLIPLQSFMQLNTPEDSTMPVYTEVQSALDTVRRMANVRYLFTAKRQNDKYVYLVDGLPLNSPDFRYIGDEIEAEIEPMLSRCMNGNIVVSEDVLLTSWGPIFFTCWPKRSPNNEVAGAIVMEFDAQNLVNKRFQITIYSLLLSLALGALFLFISWAILRNVSESFYKRLAYTDALTEMHNRTAFELDLKALERTPAPQNPVAIVVYDLDRLKFINDNYGHAAGDVTLRAMAKLISGLPFEQATHYRIGGDEFASVVTHADESVLSQRLAELRAHSLRQSFKADHFAFSYGVAVFTPPVDRDLHDTMVRSDQLMYAFKRLARLEEPVLKGVRLER